MLSIGDNIKYFDTSDSWSAECKPTFAWMYGRIVDICKIKDVDWVSVSIDGGGLLNMARPQAEKQFIKI